MMWIVAAANFNQEEAAIGHAVDRGFAAYAPRFENEYVQRGQRRKRVEFLFPPYIFVGLEEWSWYGLLGTRGISHLLPNNTRPTVIPSEWVDDLRAREVNGLIQVPKKLKRGEYVRIPRGKFMGHCGVYQGMSRRQREIVLLDSLGRVELAVGDL